MGNCASSFSVSLRPLISYTSHSKPPTQTPKQKGLQKLLLSYFHNIIHLLDQLTEPDMLQLALAESAKIVPHVINSRKAVRAYLKVRLLLCFHSVKECKPDRIL